MFQGFTQKTSDFLWDLSFNNDRVWFKEHKQEFETYMHEPFVALSKEVYKKISERYPETGWQVHISRIYRDARRLYGRPPFNDHLWFTVWRDTLDKNGPVLWFELGPKSYGYGMGYWSTKAEYMVQFRKSIEANPARFERLALEALSNPHFSLTGETYKKPKGDLGEIINPWYNRRYVGVERMEDFGGDCLLPEFPDIIVRDFASILPMYDFFCEFYLAASKGGNV